MPRARACCSRRSPDSSLSIGVTLVTTFLPARGASRDGRPREHLPADVRRAGRRGRGALGWELMPHQRLVLDVGLEWDAERRRSRTGTSPSPNPVRAASRPACSRSRVGGPLICAVRHGPQRVTYSAQTGLDARHKVDRRLAARPRTLRAVSLVDDPARAGPGGFLFRGRVRASCRKANRSDPVTARFSTSVFSTRPSTTTTTGASSR